MKRKLKSTPIEGTDWTATSYATSGRSSRRQIIVTDLTGKVICDTDECYDIGNAINSLEWKLAELLPPPAVLEAEFRAGKAPWDRPIVGKPQSIEGVYFQRWQAAQTASV